MRSAFGLSLRSFDLCGSIEHCSQSVTYHEAASDSRRAIPVNGAFRTRRCMVGQPRTIFACKGSAALDLRVFCCLGGGLATAHRRMRAFPHRVLITSYGLLRIARAAMHKAPTGERRNSSGAHTFLRRCNYTIGVSSSNTSLFDASNCRRFPHQCNLTRAPCVSFLLLRGWTGHRIVQMRIRLQV